MVELMRILILLLRATSMNKIILITGVTHGLGEAMVDEFISQGLSIFGCGRNKEKINLLNQKYKTDHFSVVDVADFEQVSAWCGNLLKVIKAPDFLINNAGIVNKNAMLENVPTDEFVDVMRVNVNGTFNVIKAFLPSMKANGSGIIINMSSGWGRTSAKEFAPYCASKFAIEGLTGSLAKELPRGLGAVSLDPGVIATAMLAKAVPNAFSVSPKPQQWAKTAVPFILQISAKDNGKQLSAP